MGTWDGERKGLLKEGGGGGVGWYGMWASQRGQGGRGGFRRDAVLEAGVGVINRGLCVIYRIKTM